MYPLMYLPATITAAQLSAEKPLVALAFKTISNKGISYQAELSKQLRQTIATKMIVDGEKSLDLLQSILVVMTWYEYPQVCSLSSCDLRNSGLSTSPPGNSS